MTKFGKAALAAGLTATLATTPLPAIAATGVQHAAAENDLRLFDQASEYHRRHWRKRRLDVDAGDVILGIGLIAAIAAIADSAGKDSRRERSRDYDRPAQPDYRGGDDVGAAVGACTEAAERSTNSRVDEIGGVRREGDGWRVTGDIGSDRFTCDVANGQVDNIRFDRRDI